MIDEDANKSKKNKVSDTVINMKSDNFKTEMNVEEGRGQTSVEDMDLIGLAIIFAIATKHVEKAASFNGVTSVSPPLPGPVTRLTQTHLLLLLSDPFPPHFFSFRLGVRESAGKNEKEEDKSEIQIISSGDSDYSRLTKELPFFLF